MQQKALTLKLIFSFILFLNVICSLAQTSKIAIFSQADTTLVHQHIGFTAVTNFTDTLHLNIPVKQYVEEKLKMYLSPNYEVSIINELPDSLSSEGVYSKWGGLRKEVKNWLTVLKSQYDVVIFTYNLSVPREMNLIIPDRTSGLYSRGKYVAYFTTIAFDSYRTSNLKRIEYYGFGGKFMTQIEDIELPEDKRTFTPDMLETIKDGIIKHIDSRIEYFLSTTYLVPKNKIDEIKGKQ